MCLLMDHRRLLEHKHRCSLVPFVQLMDKNEHLRPQFITSNFQTLMLANWSGSIYSETIELKVVNLFFTISITHPGAIAILMIMLCY